MENESERFVSPLLRQEVVKARSSFQAAEVILTVPTYAKYLALALFAIAVVLIFAALVSRLPHKQRVYGIIVPSAGIVSLTAQNTGVVQSILVTEGAAVVKGDPLFLIDDDPVLRGGDTLGKVSQQRREEQIASIEMQRLAIRDRLKTDMATNQDLLDLFRKQRALLREQIAAQTPKLMSRTNTIKKYEELEAKGFARGLDLRREREALLDLNSATRELTLRESATDADIARTSALLQTLPLDANRAVSELDDKLAMLRLDAAVEDSGRTRKVVSSTAGTVAVIPVTSGSTVKAGAILVSILPEASVLQGELFIPSRSAGLVAIGQEVRVRYDAFPYQRFGEARGIVSAISQSILLPESLGIGTPLNEPVFRAKLKLLSNDITIKQRTYKLLPGMQFQADIILEQRNLFDIVFGGS